ncbi:MAG: PrgI family protein [Candidatus Altiarchaeota archaeon]|nr:PrgI family protein [Candidatus Altiarchaeota archaeon]
MPYAIPANIKYEEKLLGSFTVKQTLYIAIGGAACAYIYLYSGWEKAVQVPAIVLLGLITAGFAMFDLDKWLTNYVSFMQTEKRSSWISPAARQLMNIKSIRADSAYLKDGRILALLKVTPINFGTLSEEDKDTVIYGFLEFLNSINFPIQIVMRSVNLELEDYLRSLKRRILQRDDKIALAYYEHFSDYMRSYIKVSRINDRHFYIVLQAEKKGNEKTMLENLETRCETIRSTLALSGIVSERLTTNQLVNFYSSYFTETFEIFDTFISPVTLYRKMWQERPKHSLMQEAASAAPAHKAEAKQPAEPGGLK